MPLLWHQSSWLPALGTPTGVSPRWLQSPSAARPGDPGLLFHSQPVSSQWFSPPHLQFHGQPGEHPPDSRARHEALHPLGGPYGYSTERRPLPSQQPYQHQQYSEERFRPLPGTENVQARLPPMLQLVSPLSPRGLQHSLNARGRLAADHAENPLPPLPVATPHRLSHQYAQAPSLSPFTPAHAAMRAPPTTQWPSATPPSLASGDQTGAAHMPWPAGHPQDPPLREAHMHVAPHPANNTLPSAPMFHLQQSQELQRQLELQNVATETHVDSDAHAKSRSLPLQLQGRAQRENAAVTAFLAALAPEVSLCCISTVIRGSPLVERNLCEECASMHILHCGYYKASACHAHHRMKLTCHHATHPATIAHSRSLGTQSVEACDLKAFLLPKLCTGVVCRSCSG